MKKKSAIISFCLLLIIGACTTISQQREISPAFYSDWDRAIRVDVDLQNMYLTTPQKIQKPIDIYMAFALALKYNYTRRVSSYEQSLLKAGNSTVNQLPEIMAQAGYMNAKDYAHTNPDLKTAWNILDISTIYYQTKDGAYKENLAIEQSRKVIHNLLQETRALYWRTLMAQKLLPTVNDMIEYITLEVDEMNIKNKEQISLGKTISLQDLEKKRKYMEAVKTLSDLKRDMETAEVRLAGLMGFHPSTQYTLVGKEYGNFDLPEIKNSLSQLEWLALTNRPELRVKDLITSVEEIKIYNKKIAQADENAYKNDPAKYNRVWSKRAQEIGFQIFEDIKNPTSTELKNLRRQRLTNLILNQVYVSWARYISAIEDYQIAQEIATTSEDIAEKATIENGEKAQSSQLDATRAIADEADAYRAYIEMQDSLGNLYASLGLDAVPYYMLNEKLSKIAVYLRNTMEKWRTGEFLPDSRPYMLGVPTKKPPLDLTSAKLMPDIELETGQKFSVTIPQEVFEKMDIKGDVITKAGLADDMPLPSWIKYNEETFTFSGMAMPSEIGQYKIKVYIADGKGNVGYITFSIKIKDVYIPSINVTGMRDGRKVLVLKRCVGTKCQDQYLDDEGLGKEVNTHPRY